MDSNVFNAAGEQQSDFTFTVGPKVDVWLPVARRALFQGTAATDLVYYATHDSERSIDPQFSGRGEIYLRRITVFGGGDYLNSRQRLNYEVDLRARHVENDGYGRRRPAAYAEVLDRSGRPPSRDRVRRRRPVRRRRAAAHAQSGNHGLQPDRSTGSRRCRRVVVRYERLEDEFEFSPARDSRSFRVMPGVEFKPRALISGSAYVGYRKFTPTARACCRSSAAWSPSSASPTRCWARRRSASATRAT